MPRSSRSAAFGFGVPASAVGAGLRIWSGQPRLLLAVDSVIVLLLVVFPFVMGGREAWGHWFLISGACLLSSLWCLHSFRERGRLRWLGLEPFLIVGLLLVWFQTKPLSESALQRVSPESARLIPAWVDLHESAAGAGASVDIESVSESRQWRTISFLPVETRHALLVLMSYGLIGAVFAQRFSAEEDCFRVLKLTGLSGVLMATFAVFQLLFSNDRFFWFYQHPWTGTREVLKGAFSNRNHFAQFLSLSVGPLIWWALAARERLSAVPQMNRRGLGPAQGNHSQIDTLVDARQLLLLAGVSGVLLAVMLSLSRGGMLSAGVACCVVFGGLWRSGRVGASLALSMILIGTLAVVGMAAFGGQKVEHRVAQLATLDADRIDESNARRSIWRADLNALRSFPLLGTGVGSHRYAYLPYMEDLADYKNCTFSHAESSWVNLALETGWLGVALLAAGWIWVGSRIVPGMIWRADASRTAALAACGAALAGGLVHSVADFIWYVPAIVVNTLALAVAGLRLSERGDGSTGMSLPRPIWLGLGAGCLVLLLGVQPELQRRITGERWWYRYLVAAFESRRNALERSESESELMPLGDSDEPAGPAGEGVPENTEDFASVPELADGNAVYDGVNAEQSPDGKQQIRELRGQLAMLLRAWKANPSHPDVAVHIARRSLELFELEQLASDNPLPLTQVRDAVINSEFGSEEAMEEFLRRAFGNSIRLPQLANAMSRKALLLCPLYIEAWKYQIATGFLSDPADRQHLRMIAQTLRLGRHDPSIRFSAGQWLFLGGRAEDALVQWNLAFHADRSIRRQICGALAPRVGVQSVLSSFVPNIEELEDVFEAYQQQESSGDLRRLLEVVLEQTRKVPEAYPEAMSEGALEESGEVVAEVAGGESASVGAQSSGEIPDGYGNDKQLLRFLMSAAVTAGEMKLLGQQETLLRRAATVAPDAESPRRALGLLLFEREEYESADRLFASCAELNPGDTRLEGLRRECRRLEKAKARRTRMVSEGRLLRAD